MGEAALAMNGWAYMAWALHRWPAGCLFKSLKVYTSLGVLWLQLAKLQQAKVSGLLRLRRASAKRRAWPAGDEKQ